MQRLFRYGATANIQVDRITLGSNIARFYGSRVKRFHIFINEFDDAKDGGGRVVMPVNILKEIGSLSGNHALLIELNNRAFPVLCLLFVQGDHLLVELSQTFSGI